MQAAETSDSLTTSSPRSEFHHLFASPEGDIVLGSKDGVLFRVHSYTLKTTSGWFRAMYTLPQRPSDARPELKAEDATPDVIYVDEDSQTLEGLLRMVCGLSIPKLDSYDFIEPILHAAEKYDMPGPMSIIRALLSTPSLMSDPLRLYAVTCRYGWQDEAMMASRATLTLNLHSPENRNTLQKLGTEAPLSLFSLHRIHTTLCKLVQITPQQDARPEGKRTYVPETTRHLWQATSQSSRHPPSTGRNQRRALFRET